MTRIITGCIDCPLFDNNGVEYGTYCHHPKRKFDVTFTSLDGDRNFVYTEIRDEQEKINYDNEVKRYNTLSWEEMENERKGKPWTSICISEEPIEDDENRKPITPDWCPLKIEAITISF